MHEHFEGFDSLRKPLPELFKLVMEGAYGCILDGEHRATIVCHTKHVIFGDLNNHEFVYHGSQPGKPIKIISALKARALISHGCYKYHPLHVVLHPLDQIREDLSIVEEPEEILDHQDRVMINKTITFIKIIWKNHPEREATWETEESIRASYPHIFL
nr:hypothetical protein [Tanacetum cinerariifolium]